MRRTKWLVACGLLLPCILFVILWWAGIVTLATFKSGHRPELVRKGATIFLDLHGMEYGEVLNRLGEPKSNEIFRLGWGQPEYRTELFNLFSPRNPFNWLVRVKESKWTIGGQTIIVWFYESNGTWTAIDSVKQDADIAF